MRTVLELIADALIPMGSVAMMRNPHIARITRVERIEQVVSDVKPDTLYILVGADLSQLRLRGNYIVAHHLDVDLTEAIGPQTNVLKVSHLADLKEVERISSAYCEAERIFTEWSFDMMDALSGPTPVTGVCRIISELIGNPVTITDTSFKPVTSANCTNATNEMWEGFIRGKLTEPPEGTWKWASTADTALVAARPIIFPGSEQQPSWIRCGIRSNGVVRHALFALAIARPFEIRDTAIVAIACDMLGNMLIPEENSHIDSQNLLASILEGTITEPALIVRGTEDIGITIEQPTYLTTLYIDGRTPSYMEVLEATGFARAHLHCTVLTHGLEVVALLPGGDPSKPPVKRLNSLVKRLGKEWRAALSFPFSSVTSLHDAWEQCRSARKFGSRFLPDLLVQDYAYYAEKDLLDQVGRQLRLSRFATPLAQEMYDYDQKNGTEYARTMMHYLKSLRFSDKTAEQLSVHRNTVLYRIERIREIFGIDVENLGLMNALALAFDILSIEHPEYGLD
jgi:hypothetical protein